MQPLRIMDKKETILRNRVISWVKVQWKNFILEEANWEMEEVLRKRYQGLFPEVVKEY